MKQKAPESAPAGSMLDRPAILLPETHGFSLFCFYAVLLFLAVSGAMGCFFTAFQIKLDPSSVIPMAVICVLVCAGQFLLPKYGRWLGLAAALFWAILLWNSFDDTVEAFKRVVNEVSMAYSERLNFSLPIFLNLESIFQDRLDYLFNLFALLLLFPLSWLLSWMLIRHKATLSAFCLTGIFLLFPLSFSILPDSWALGALLMFWMFLLLAAPTLHQRRLLLEEQRRYQAAGVGFLRVSTLALLAACALSLFTAWKLCPVETYERPEVLNEIRSSLTRGVRLPSIFRGGTGEGTGGGNDRVDLSALGDRNFTGQTVLRVKKDWQNGVPRDSDAYEKEYLKSFVGSVYTGTSWEKLSREDAAEAARLLGEQKAQTLSADLTALLPTGDSSEDRNCTLSVENVASNLQCVYSPYDLSGLQELPGGTSCVDDAFLESSRFFGLDAYEFTCKSPRVPDRHLFYADRLSAALAPFSQPETSDGVETIQLDEKARDLQTLPEGGRAALPQSAQALTRSAEAYAPFVYQHYTQVPEGLRETLDRCWAEILQKQYLGDTAVLSGGSSDETITIPSESGSGMYSFSLDPANFSRTQLIYSVQDYFQQNFTYTLSPPAMPQGKDFAEYFLTESREGYCVHFATAAVALFRAAGIPARYAEGYAVPAAGDGFWVDVPDRNAHAWAEVWFGGAGWVPVEVTPAVAGAPAAYSTAQEPELEPTPTPRPISPTVSQTQESSPSPQPGQSSPSPAPLGGGNQKPAEPDSHSSALLLWAAIPAGAALLLFLLWLQRVLRVRYRKRCFAQRDRNKGAILAYAHILRLNKAAALLPRSDLKMPDELRQLALKARFSNHRLTEQELGKFTQFAPLLEKKLKRELPLLSRLKCEYLLALF